MIRLILDAYYDVQFSSHSHGFREGRGCHTALQEIYHTWGNATWIIEGDISDCFGSLPHEKILSILREKIHDGRFLHLVEKVLNAGYLEEWKYHRTGIDLSRKTAALIRQSRKGADEDNPESRLRQEGLERRSRNHAAF